MSQMCTGWEDLYLAQVLWSKVLAGVHGCQVNMTASTGRGVGLVPVDGSKLPIALRQELSRLASRAEQVANCTCDVCGKHAFIGTRCSDHRDSADSNESPDIEGLWDLTVDPMMQLECMISKCIDIALMGPTELVLNMMYRDDRLYAAVCTRNELAGVEDPCGDRAAQLVMQADRRHTRRACRRTQNANGRTKYHPLAGLEEDAFWCQGHSEVHEMLVKDPTLEAIARTCERYRDKPLSKNLRGALAMLDSDRAHTAIANID